MDDPVACFPFDDASLDCCAPFRAGDPCEDSLQCQGAMRCEGGVCVGQSLCESACLRETPAGKRDCCRRETTCATDSDCRGARVCADGRCVGDSACAAPVEPRKVSYDRECICTQPGNLCTVHAGVPCATRCMLTFFDDGSVACALPR